MMGTPKVHASMNHHENDHKNITKMIIKMIVTYAHILQICTQNHIFSLTSSARISTAN